MKKIIFFIIFYIISFTNLSFAQWQPDVRLTNDTSYSYTSYNNAWCITSSGNNVHVVWHDERDGNSEIYYKLSTSGGVNWGADIRLTNNSAFSGFPSIALSDQSVHVIWSDQRSANQGIFYKRSSNGGTSWGDDKQLTYSTSNSHYPSLAVSGQNVHVVWQENLGSNNYEIYYIRSTNGGISWEYEIRLTNNLAYSSEASIAVSGQIVNVVWHDARDGNYEVYAKHSQDGGASWGADTRLTNNSAFSYVPSIAMSGQTVHVVWFDDRDGNFEIYYKRSTDGGNNWGADTRLTNNSYESEGPSISVSGQIIHVVWYEYLGSNNYEIYYKRSTDGGYNWEADTRLTNNPSYSSNPSVTASAQSVHVVWFDDREGKTKIYYKLNPTGNLTGINPINSEIPSKYSLSQNYPNPFNSMTNVKWSMSNSGYARITVYDLRGREVKTLVNESLQPGIYETSFDASELASGIYFYRLMVNSVKNDLAYTETRRMILVK